MKKIIQLFLKKSHSILIPVLFLRKSSVRVGLFALGGENKIVSGDDKLEKLLKVLRRGLDFRDEPPLEKIILKNGLR